MAINPDSGGRSFVRSGSGDGGDTSLFSGERVRKDSPFIEAVGTLDELGALLGLIRTESLDSDNAETLKKIQKKLFDVSACVINPVPTIPCIENGLRAKTARLVSECDVEDLESKINRVAAKLTPIHDFLLPGENRVSALLHVARTVARRAERRVVALPNLDRTVRPILLAWLNRLSELLFALARFETPDQRKDV